MHDNSNAEQTIVVQLNELADHWVETGKFPETVSEAALSDLIERLYEHVEPLIDTYVTELEEPRHIAQTEALSNHADVNDTPLTQEAYALVIATPGTSFSDTPTETVTYPDRNDVELSPDFVWINKNRA